MKKLSVKSRRYFFGIFALTFLVFCLVSETVLAILNAIIMKGRLLEYTVPLYIMPFAALLFTMAILHIIRVYNRKSEILIEHMNKVAAGDYSVRIVGDNRTGKEFGKIYENFNAMTAELASVEGMREEFIHSFSHELKTPLSSVNGFANLLLEGGLTEEERKKFLKIIADESARLLSLTDSLLTMSRLENQQVAGETEEVRLDAQINDCIVMLERDWEKKNINISTDLLPVTVRANRELLLHVWTNILSNAIKYTPEGGDINASMTAEGDFIRVDIRDTGIGMSPADAARAFEKYYRAESAAGTEGSGLGLAICKRICALCGGEISVVSAPGEGSTFTVRLPL